MIPYTCIRSRRKTVCLEVRHDGQVILWVPQHMRAADADAFVHAHTDWIAKKQAAAQKQAALHPPHTAAQIDALRASVARQGYEL